MSIQPELGVTKFVSIIHNSKGTRFMVFETGDPKFYLFNVLIPFPGIIACSTISFAVRKATLRDDVKSMLKHGFGMVK